MKTITSTLALSLLWTALVLLFGVSSGWLTLAINAPWLVSPGAFLYRHLQLSIVPFSALLLIYFFLITQVKHLLADGQVTMARLSYYDRLLNAIISTFFGVGVIWTAVGMESALIQAVDGISGSQEMTTALGPRDLLERLVNGGLLLALSTTIFGGVCGYLLRLLKIVLLGEKWDHFILQEADCHEKTDIS